MKPTPASLAATQDAARVTGHEAWGIVSRLIGGMLLYGALGWLVGQWLGNPTAGLAVGAMLGMGLGIYLSVVRVNQLGTKSPALDISGSNSWSARMTRARIEREVSDGS